MLVGLVTAVGFGWLQYQDLLKRHDSLQTRFDLLESRLSSTDESVTQSGAAMQLNISKNKDELKKAGWINGALHIPLPELRGRLEELDPEKNYILFCAIGLRGYVGYRILSQKGLKAKNLGGGYKTFLGAKEKIMAEFSKQYKDAFDFDWHDFDYPSNRSRWFTG